MGTITCVIGAAACAHNTGNKKCALAPAICLGGRGQHRLNTVSGGTRYKNATACVTHTARAIHVRCASKAACYQIFQFALAYG